MANDDLVPFHVREGGAQAVADFQLLRESQSEGLRIVFRDFFRATLGAWSTNSIPRRWRANEPRCATLHRQSGLSVLPANGEIPEKLSAWPPMQLLAIVELVLAMDQVEERRAWARTLSRAMKEDRFAYQVSEDPPYRVARALPAGVEALVSAAATSATAGRFMKQALLDCAGLDPSPAASVLNSQKAVEIAYTTAFRMTGSTLGMLVGELRKGSKRFALPRSSKAPDTAVPTPVAPNDTVRGMIEAVQYANVERHADASDSAALSVADARNVLGLAALLVDWLERGQIVPA